MINSLLRMPADANPYCVHHHMNQNESTRRSILKDLLYVDLSSCFFQVFKYLSILRPLFMLADTALELQVGADDISTVQK